MKFLREFQISTEELEILLEVKRLDPELGAIILPYEANTEGPTEISD